MKSQLALLLALTLLSSSRAEEARFFCIVGPVATTITAFGADCYLTWTNTPTNATFTVQTTSSLLSPIDWVDYVQVPATNSITTLQLCDLSPPSGMALIPAGAFTMGDTFSDGSVELPLHTVYVSAFYMDRYEVTKALWDDVYLWAISHGYGFDNAGLGKAANHPVQFINWYDMVKWCNARSEKEGRVPAYYTSAALTSVYRTGTNDLPESFVKWNVGYRLPTEAEWEKAARGGASGDRFPWPDVDTISHSRANYYADTNSYAYDVSSTQGNHPTYATGAYPYTSPVGSFAANGYGLYDMAGNVLEWCWDWWDDSWYSNAGATQNDTRGPAGPLSDRVLRGGSWYYGPDYSRCAFRSRSNPVVANDSVGFRCVRGL